MTKQIPEGFHSVTPSLTFKDPFGYCWAVATKTRDLTEEQVRKGAEAFFAGMAKK